MKLAIVIGTRPQIIKTAPVIHSLRAISASKGIELEIINTGQHYDYEMNKQFFEELSLPDPSFNLETGHDTPSRQIAKIVSGLNTVFEYMPPDLALIPGDTNSALAAGIACSKNSIPIAHLESGARANELRMSEEVNRRILDQIGQVLLCPTPKCRGNLMAERALADVIEYVGDTMLDSLFHHMDAVAKSPALKTLNLRANEYGFMTLHRAENTDNPDLLQSILNEAGNLNTDIVFAVHPRTRRKLAQFNIMMPKNIVEIEPLPYIDTLVLAKHAVFVITDSGGLQKEACWLGKPVIIPRDSTEWIELIESGVAFLAGNNGKKINEICGKLGNIDQRNFEVARQYFGDGKASVRVVEVMLQESRLR